jgi:hypothetical protein
VARGTLPGRRNTLAFRGLVGAVALWIGLSVMVPTVVHAQSPSPGVIGGGDTRSDGEGPGFVGSPLLVAAGVVVLGALTAGGTLLYLRLTRDD